MNKDTFKLDKALSIVELENRQELTVISTSIEVRKGEDPGCGCGSGGGDIGLTVGGRCGI
jgi:hypothetical protein